MLSASAVKRRLHDVDTIYCYDGTFAGFLCCVFEAFERREQPAAIWPPALEQPTMFPIRGIETDKARAERVFAGMRRKTGNETRDFVVRAFLSGQEDKEWQLLRFLDLAFAAGPYAIEWYGHPFVAPIYEMQHNLSWEVDKFQGFVRFVDYNRMLVAVIHPKNYILPLLRGHFCARFPGEDFLIYDASHGMVLLHKKGRAEILTLAAPLELPPPDAKEQEFQELWKQFYDTLAIDARRNERCRMTHCPKRFWQDMTELNGQKYG